MCLRCPVYMLCIPEHGKVVCKYAILNIASRWQQCTWLANTSMQHRIKLEHDPQSMQSVLLVFSLLSSSFAIHMYTDTCTNTLMYHTSNNQFSLFFQIVREHDVFSLFDIQKHNDTPYSAKNWHTTEQNRGQRCLWPEKVQPCMRAILIRGYILPCMLVGERAHGTAFNNSNPTQSNRQTA